MLFMCRCCGFIQAWTNNSLTSAEHRVVPTGDKDRLSIQLFSIPHPDYTVKDPKRISG
uniref:Oxidoreductase, 2OG-Fe(II) oxygenase family protein n=1 Tax=Solanum tuberosum TaxID=4113 RepID=M1D5H8_SOLTU